MREWCWLRAMLWFLRHPFTLGITSMGHDYHEAEIYTGVTVQIIRCASCGQRKIAWWLERAALRADAGEER